MVVLFIFFIIFTNKSSKRIKPSYLPFFPFSYSFYLFFFFGVFGEKDFFFLLPSLCFCFVFFFFWGWQKVEEVITSIALERIEASGFGRRVMNCPCDSSRFESTPVKETKEVVVEEEDDWRSSSSTTTSSSIGRNSDDDDDVSGRSSDGRHCDENEVQSPYKGGLDIMDSLQQVLPMRRGISNFYNGKSKSFTSLADSSSTSSIKDIAKPENAYTRRRRNLLAINHVWDKNRNKRPIRPISSSKSTLALVVAMSSSESLSSTSEDSTSTSSTRLPPLHPQTRTSFNNNNTPSSPPSTGRNFSSWRSFSLADVREYSTVTGSSTNPHCSLIHDDRTNSKKDT